MCSQFHVLWVSSESKALPNLVGSKTKSEYRNSKQARNRNDWNLKRRLPCFCHSHIVISGLFRVSYFDIRIWHHVTTHGLQAPFRGHTIPRPRVRESFLANHLIGIAIEIEIGVVKSLAKCLSISNPISIAISSLARNISRTPLLQKGIGGNVIYTSRDRIAQFRYKWFDVWSLAL